jgi:2-C-methyl-D-erythritol 4-phosphate cytidylyltransferase/2-C-methyl-D-erythritol 2,4-cyclodiphosphate synthase
VEPDAAIVILLGAGAGRRLGGGEPKALLPIGGRPVLAVAAAAAAASPPVGGLVVTFPPGWEGRARACVEDLSIDVRFVEGGETRQASVRAALEMVPDSVDIVAVHDAARPFAPPDLFTRVLEGLDGADGAVPVLAVADTVLRVRDEVVEGVEAREQLVLGQTPQAFRTAALRKAHAKAEAVGAAFTDDASLLRWAGSEVRAIPGDPENAKITTLADLAQADRRMGTTGG